MRIGLEEAPPDHSTISRMRRLATAGWDQNTVKPGDRITVIGRVIKDGSKKMFLEKIVVNGKEWERGRR